MRPCGAWSSSLGVLMLVLGVGCAWPSSSPPETPAPEPLSPAQRYAQDCAAPLFDEPLAEDIPFDAVECEHLPIPQSCASDPSGCEQRVIACGEGCVPDCRTCRDACVEGCGGCRAACAEGDAACALACGEARAACQVSCLRPRDACVEPCVDQQAACVAAFEVERASLCPDCQRISDCPFPGSDPTAPCSEGAAEFVAKFPGNDPRCFGWCVLF
jgi:hypothetical protein